MTFINQKLGNKLKFVPPRCYSEFDEFMALGLAHELYLWLNAWIIIE